MAEREFRVLVHEESGVYWGEVAELPGCFASGTNLDELREAVVEAISLYLTDDVSAPGTPSTSGSRGRVEEMRVLVSA